MWTFKYVPSANKPLGWSSNPHKSHGWSFYCGVGAAALLPFASALMIVSAVRKHDYTLVTSKA